MRTFPNQRVSTKEKDKPWRINSMDAICNMSTQYTADWDRIQKNYNMKNSQLTQAEYRDICSGLGVSDKDTTRRYVEAYNICANIVKTLMGEESSRPWSFNVINDNPYATNEIQRHKEREYQMLMMDLFNHESEKKDAMYKASMEALAKELPEKEVDKKMQMIQEQYAMMEKKIFDPKRIETKYKNKQTTKELLIKKLMRALVQRQNIKWTKNKTFEDAIVAGIELAEVVQENEFSYPTVKELDPLNVFYHKSPNTPFIQDGEYAGYREYMTVSKVLQQFGHLLSDEDLEMLKNRQLKGIYGLDQTMYNGKSASSADALQASGMYPSQNTWNVTGNPGGAVGMPYGTGNAILNPGLYANTHNYYNNALCTVYTVYWISQRKVGVLRYKNEYGQPDFDIVSEDFEVPKDAKTSVIKNNEFDRPSKRLAWIDDTTGQMQTLEWIWIPEVWKGNRINGSVYCNIGPVKHAYQSLTNPYNVKLPIYGYVYNNRNSHSLSMMDTMRPWQKLYYVIMSKMLKMITKDHGILTFLNTAFIDDKLGIEKTLELAEETGIIMYNPLQHTKGFNGNLLNTFKAAETVDIQNSKAVEYYIKLLQFIEDKMTMATGMSPQRLAQTQDYTNASDNQRETAHSMNMTEEFFAGHDLLWQEIMQGLMEQSLSIIKTDNMAKTMREFLDDNEIALLKMEDISIYDDFKLRIGNDAKSYRILEMMKQNSQALIQNGLPMSQLVSLLRTEDLIEFQENLKEIEEMERQERQQAEENKMKMEQERTKALRDIAEDEQINNLDIAYLKGKLDQELAHIQGQYTIKSYNMDKDLNANQVPDVMEFNLRSGDLIKKAEQKDMELQLKARQQDLDQNKLAIETSQQEAEREMKRQLESQKLTAEQKAHQEKLEVEREKIKAMAAKANASKNK